jgi:hypothetical protein
MLRPGAIWKHMVVMIRAGIRRERVRKAVTDLTGNGSIVGYYNIELEKPAVDDMPSYAVSSDPFQV